MGARLNELSRQNVGFETQIPRVSGAAASLSEFQIFVSRVSLTGANYPLRTRPLVTPLSPDTLLWSQDIWLAHDVHRLGQ